MEKCAHIAHAHAVQRCKSANKTHNNNGNGADLLFIIAFLFWEK